MQKEDDQQIPSNMIEPTADLEYLVESREVNQSDKNN